MKPRDRLTLTIDRPAAGGRMIARHNGSIVLVAATIPGEIVEAEVEKVQRGTIWATTRRVITPSPDRVDPGGDWSCGGSVFAHIAYERQLAIKRDIVRDGFTRIGRLPIPADVAIAGSRVDGYRMRARLHLRDGRLGFFREGTHVLCAPEQTRQLLPETIEALQQLQQALRAVANGAITDVDVSENCAGSERACHLELAAGADTSRLGSLPQVEGINGLSSAVANNPHTLDLWGTPVVTDDISVAAASGRIETIRLSRHARSFFQGNRYLLSDLVAAVVAELADGRVLDLYAGVGLFAVAAATARGAEVTAVEGDRSSADDLKANISRAGVPVNARQQAVEVFLTVEHGARPGTIIVDPPRTGISREAMAGVIGLSAPRIVYVSCDVATLARDARLLTDAGYGLHSLRLFDLFPNTAHVESVAVFDR